MDSRDILSVDNLLFLHRDVCQVLIRVTQGRTRYARPSQTIGNGGLVGFSCVNSISLITVCTRSRGRYSGHFCRHRQCDITVGVCVYRYLSLLAEWLLIISAGEILA